MKGLVLKDMFNLWKSVKQMVIVLAVISICIIMSGGGDGMPAVCGIIAVSLVITTFAIDERCGWPKFALTMPISKMAYVAAKYITAVVLCLAGVLFGTIVAVAAGSIAGNFDLPLMWENFAAGIIAALIFSGIIIPLMLKFGTENARIILIGIVGVPSLALWAIGRKVDLDGIEITSDAEIAIGICLVVATIIINVVSYFISLRIMNKKEF